MKYLGNSESFEDSLEDSDIEDQFNEAASSYKTNDNNGDSIELDVSRQEFILKIFL